MKEFLNLEKKMAYFSSFGIEPVGNIFASVVNQWFHQQITFKHKLLDFYLKMQRKETFLTVLKRNLNYF